MPISVGASTFTATADSRSKGKITLVQVDFPAYGLASALTLRLATSRYVDPDGNLWDPALAGEPDIDHGGGWLLQNWQPADAVVHVQDRLLSCGSKLSTLLATYPPHGARVQILQAFDNLVSTSEFKTLFDGLWEETQGIDLSGVLFQAVQSRAWDKLFPARVVTKDDFANAPNDVIGTAIPVVLGDWETRHRYLDGAGGTWEAIYAGIARGGCPMLPVESPTGTGVALPRYIISDDEIDQGSLPGGAPYDQWYLYDNALDTMVGAGIGTLSNPADGPATTTLYSLQVNGAILPIEAYPSNTADYVDEMFRKDKPRDLAGYSYLNWTSSKRALRVQLPDVGIPGTFVSAAVWCFYSYPGTAGTVPKLRIWNDASGASDQSSFPSASSGWTGGGFEAVQICPVVNAITAFATPSGDPQSPWQDVKNCWLEVALGGSGQEMKVHRLVLGVVYKAAARIERPGTARDVEIVPRGSKLYPFFAGFTRKVSSPDITTFDSTLYGFPKGRKDTAAGIYTGTPNALIEHPVDMVRYLLKRWGGVSAGEFVETSGEYGSFADAKAALSGYRFRTILSARAKISDAVKAIAAESLCWFGRCPTLPGAPWVALPWEDSGTVDYRTPSEPFIFSRATNHVVEQTFKVGSTALGNVANTVRVNYDWDPRTNTYGDQLYITPTASRVAILSNFGPDTTREATAAASATLYGEKELVLSLKMVTDADTATAILWRAFDLNVNPRLTVEFDTLVNAYDLNRGHVIGFNADWDSRVAYPKPGSDASWANKPFRVIALKRLSSSPINYHVEAVEV